MATSDNGLPDCTLETLVRSFFRESSSYGFRQIDYIRFVNLLLDLSMKQAADSAGGEAGEKQQENDYDTDPEVGAMELPIRSERVIIRKIDTARDTRVLKQWLDDESGRQFLLSRITAQTLDIDRIIDDDWNVFGMITTPDEAPVGCVAYLGFNPEQHKAELRKLIGDPAMRGKGYAKEATRLWIRYGINTLRLRKIHLSTLNTDIRNIRLNESLGFKVEGILRNEICVDGIYRDVLRMGLWSE